MIKTTKEQLNILFKDWTIDVDGGDGDK